MTKNEKIKQSNIETRLKRKTQVLKVFELKINCHHTSKETFDKVQKINEEMADLSIDILNSFFFTIT